MTRKTHWRIWKSDCIAAMQRLRRRWEKPKLVFADPPFNLSFAYDVHQDDMALRDYLNWCRRWLGKVWETIHEHGTFWLAMCDEHVSELDLMAREIGFHRRSWIPWYYTFGVHCENNFARSHTHLLYYVRDKNHFTFNKDAVRVPSARQLVYNDKRADPAGKLPDNTWILSPFDLAKAFDGTRLDTWLVSRVCGTFRERQKGAVNQMPEELLERVVLATSAPKDLVFDPFGGTFTTGVASVRHQRNFVGCDISDEYCGRGRVRVGKTLAAAQTKPAANL